MSDLVGKLQTVGSSLPEAMFIMQLLKAVEAWMGDEAQEMAAAMLSCQVSLLRIDPMISKQMELRGHSLKTTKASPAL